MGTYNRLIKLYRHSNSLTPFEDFTTEILAGILEEHDDILKIFLTNLLQLPGEGYEFRTQKTYSLNKDNSVRIDMVFWNDDTLCFLENKVESGEGYLQLENYESVLDEIAREKNTCLRYCTKYFDQKDIKSHEFHQFRWSDISQILSNFRDRPQINDFYTFLKQHNMSDQLEISAKELFLLENLKDTISTLDNFLDRIKPAFIKRFGKTNNAENLSQMKNHNRYITWKKGVFGKGGVTEIGFGFGFKEKPRLSIWIWASGTNDQSKRFYEIIKDNQAEYDPDNKGWFNAKIDLNSFLAYEKPVEEMEKWFIEKSDFILEFIKKTPELEWKVGQK